MTQTGYCDTLSNFVKSDVTSVVDALKLFVPDAGESQVRAWRDSIRLLRQSVEQMLDIRGLSETASILLEYAIPLENRRIDALLLLNGVVVVVEFKGKTTASRADIDQAAAYARDLRAYHRECEKVPVKCALVLTRTSKILERDGEVDVVSPDQLASHCETIILNEECPNADDFIVIDCYQPLPSLIKAARELFKTGNLKRIHRAAVATEPTLESCSSIVYETATKKRRALILICGVPGAGKTLIGLQLAHAKYLDSLAIRRESGEKPTAAAVFLSGNGPLVEVLQYELRIAGGDGKAFVRGVHEYVKTFTRKPGLIPPHHVLIYDEAQRAFDAAQVKAKHKDMPTAFQGLSEPELFIQFAEHVPEWCVVVGLIGSGQEIHIGEEAGLGQWKNAIDRSDSPESWDVYIPNIEEIGAQFDQLQNVQHESSLELSETIRFHLATRLYEFVENVLDGNSENAKKISIELEKNGYNLRLTHILDRAKSYLFKRYDKNSDARFGIVASAKDKDLTNHDIPKGFKSPGEVRPGKYGKWYSESFGSLGSCTGLDSVATEFGAQGLELDACLLAWGTDFIRRDGRWSTEFAAGYRDSSRVLKPASLRMNSYRVLLTRGRDACVVFVPPIPDKTRETFKFLKDCGFSELSEH
tara:strand:+ start:2341 stop:4269 length:1929 start_codon:yes stop_codon:yes gene_type:complete